MFEVKAIYPVLVVGMSILPITFGFLLLLFRVPKDLELQAYRSSRVALAVAYIVFGLLNVGEAITMQDNAGEDRLKLANFCLIIASTQAYLFTYSIIALIDPGVASPQWKRYQLWYISGFSILTFTGFFVQSTFFSYSILFLFSCFYIYQLINYTYLFLKKRKIYIRKVDDYFSGNEIQWLKWIDLAFFSALSIGVGAFFLVLFTSPWFNFLFTVICFLFYFFFAIKYLEYPQRFHHLLPVIVPEQKNGLPNDLIEQYSSLESKLKQWVDKKYFLTEGLTIQDVSMQVDVNRFYLSFYIRTYLQMNFNSWIKKLKQKEQQELLRKKVITSIDSTLFERIEKMVTQQKLFLDVDLCRADLAKRLQTNTLYLIESIRENTGMTLGEYFNDLRLDYARTLLLDIHETDLPISVIALSSGFKSLRTFNRTFKEKFGITPKEMKIKFAI